MLWNHYVFRRGPDVPALWDDLYAGTRGVRVAYISGRGFDLRAQWAMSRFVDSLGSTGAQLDAARLVLVDPEGYELSQELTELTSENAEALRKLFADLGASVDISIATSRNRSADRSATVALREGIEAVLAQTVGFNDIVLDVSSLPRVVYLGILTSLLSKIVGSGHERSLSRAGIRLQVLVAEDASLDSEIRGVDLSSELVMIPGFGGGLQEESSQSWPLVWFPVLGEGRVAQLQKIVTVANIPEFAEVCPVLPHPSRDPRRADKLLIEYREPLFDARETSTSSVMYVHESNPFEAYRQLFGAMQRYYRSLRILDKCRIVVTPLAAKLVTVGVGLACYDMRSAPGADGYRVALPHVEPRRYEVSGTAVRAARPELAVLLLTGDAYE